MWPVFHYIACNSQGIPWWFSLNLAVFIYTLKVNRVFFESMLVDGYTCKSLLMDTKSNLFWEKTSVTIFTIFICVSVWTSAASASSAHVNTWKSAGIWRCPCTVTSASRHSLYVQSGAGTAGVPLHTLNHSCCRDLPVYSNLDQCTTHTTC